MLRAVFACRIDRLLGDYSRESVSIRWRHGTPPWRETPYARMWRTERAGPSHFHA